MKPYRGEFRLNIIFPGPMGEMLASSIYREQAFPPPNNKILATSLIECPRRFIHDEYLYKNDEVPVYASLDWDYRMSAEALIGGINRIIINSSHKWITSYTPAEFERASQSSSLPSHGTFLLDTEFFIAPKNEDHPRLIYKPSAVIITTNENHLVSSADIYRIHQTSLSHLNDNPDLEREREMRVWMFLLGEYLTDLHQSPQDEINAIMVNHFRDGGSVRGWGKSYYVEQWKDDVVQMLKLLNFCASLLDKYGGRPDDEQILSFPAIPSPMRCKYCMCTQCEHCIIISPKNLKEAKI